MKKMPFPELQTFKDDQALVNQADFWTEYSLNVPFPFGMLDLI